MAIQLTISNMLQLTSTLSPVLLTFFLVMLSLFNLNLKGIMYLSGVLLATFISYMIGFAWGGDALLPHEVHVAPRHHATPHDAMFACQQDLR